MLTPSKDNKRAQSSMKNSRFHQVIVEEVKTEGHFIQPNKCMSSKRNLVTMRQGAVGRKDFDTIDSETSQGIGKINSLDLESKRMLNTRL